MATETPRLKGGPRRATWLVGLQANLCVRWRYRLSNLSRGFRLARRTGTARHAAVLATQRVPGCLWRSLMFPFLLIGSEPWIPVATTNGYSSSRRCISHATGARELQAVFPVPVLDSEHPLFHNLSIDARLFRLSLERTGIRPHPTDLTWDEC